MFVGEFGSWIRQSQWYVSNRPRREIGASAHDLVVDRRPAGEHARAAFLRGVQAHQADDISAVRVEAELTRGSRAEHVRRAVGGLRRRRDDVGQHVAGTVLPHRVAEPQTEQEEDRARQLVRVLADPEAAHEHEAETVIELLGPLGDPRRADRERVVVAVEGAQVGIGGDEPRALALELIQLGVAQPVHEFGRGHAVVAAPAGAADDLLWRHLQCGTSHGDLPGNEAEYGSTEIRSPR